jgi:hypothetical protein
MLKAGAAGRPPLTLPPPPLSPPLTPLGFGTLFIFCTVFKPDASTVAVETTFCIVANGSGKTLSFFQTCVTPW